MADERLIPPGIRDQNSLAINDILDRIGNLDITPVLVYKIDEVIADALPHLAEQFHILGWEGWALAETEEARRELVRKAIALHRKRGTPWAVKEAVKLLGYDCEIVEAKEIIAAWKAAGGRFLDGSVDLSVGGYLYAPGGGEFEYGPTSWAQYVLHLDIAAAEYGPGVQSKIAALARLAAPARSWLMGLKFFLGLDFSALITFAALPEILITYDECLSSHVPHYDIIGWGCREIGGTYVERYIDGGMLDGKEYLSGIKPSGEYLEKHRWGTWAATITTPQHLSFGGDLDELLSFDDLQAGNYISYLDGSYSLSHRVGAEAIWQHGFIDHYHDGYYHREGF